jgi:hypothetical protein
MKHYVVIVDSKTIHGIFELKEIAEQWITQNKLVGLIVEIQPVWSVSFRNTVPGIEEPDRPAELFLTHKEAINRASNLNCQSAWVDLV